MSGSVIMNRYLEKIAEFTKEAGNPAAIAQALARKTLGKPKGWKMSDMKPSELNFNRSALADSAKKLNQDAMRKAPLSKSHNVIRSTDGIEGRFSSAKDVPSLTSGMQRQKVLNEIGWLKTKFPRRPTKPKPPGGL